MVDRSAGPTASTQWETFSRQYWDAVQQWQQASAAGAAPGAGPPWHEGLAQWARLFGDPGQQPALAERMLASVKAYLERTQALFTAGNGVQAEDIAARFSEALRSGAAFAPGLGMPSADHPLAAALRQIGGEGARSLEQLAAGFGPMLGTLAGEARTWLDQPAFGFLRERQEHQQRTAQALIDYQEQTARYNALILKAGQRGASLFENKLGERGAAERPVESLRALYDLWVDAAEEGYAEVAASAEFREVYGALVNAQMKLRSQLQQDIERMSVELGIPTRSEVDSLGRRLHELRREVRCAGSGGALATEVAALRREVAALKAAGRRSGAAEPPKPTAKAARAAPRPVRPRAAKKAAPPKPRRPARAAGGFEARVAQFAKTAKTPAAGKRKAKPARSSD
ncbi:class III poly(R)-hydroxyalkanoic acid synthase subunit PhaE [Dokdonella koreensis]|uniref:Poly(3-hydroxyalkanoate) polymerase subunit PhaE n=1 Tax=Dokdonella koreensis DS-123 TaxID=1300342 RepID=A0A160DW65_9GAMM|nr:class III poly(R)-hydroxyalkanoic acid synthase subunit PhaE [Dokdonella koreensis]ANB18431.1 PHA synthase subunit [Dokdonella koreensis DS-123]